MWGNGVVITMADPEKEATRMIAIGPADLVQGFKLIGFETVPDASPEDMDRLLNELLDTRQRALVLLETNLSRSDSAVLHRVRTRSARIVLAELPQLGTPREYRSPVEHQIARVLGPGILERNA